MKKGFKLLIVLLLIFTGFVQQGQAQYVTKKVKSKHQAYTDSLKSVEYNYTFPIWGQAAYKQGFDIPYPIGIMSNFIWMDQGIDITNMQLGIKTDNKDIPLTSTDFIDFGDSYNESYAFNVRPDLWILPFLNVYGLFGYGQSTTEVNLVAPVALKSIVTQGIRTTGLGVMTAFGIGPAWVSVDANWTWNKPELLDKATRVNVLGLRLGQTFTFKQRPERNIAIWVGGMRVKMGTETTGAIAMSDAFPQETWDRKEEIVDDYNAWYATLPPAKQLIVDQSAIREIITKLENSDGSSIIRYGMDKQVSQMWNGVVGMQFQLNKRWQFRTEAGLIGDRKSFMLSVNYRFLSFKKQ